MRLVTVIITPNQYCKFGNADFTAVVELADGTLELMSVDEYNRRTRL